MENVSAAGRTVATKSRARKSNKVERVSSKKNTHQVEKKAAKPKKTEVQAAGAPEVPVVAAPVVVAQPVVETRKQRNLERFLEATGKTQQDYYTWATEVGRRMHINKLDALVCARLGIYTVAHLVEKPTPMPEDIGLAELDEHLALYSENPYELATLWMRLQGDAQAWVSKESILNEWLTGIRKEDFEHYGDKNHAGDVSKKWWVKDSVALDAKLHEINDMQLLNEEITPEDAIDFIKAHKPNGYVNPVWKLVAAVESRFKEVTTFRIKDYYVQHLVNMCQGVRVELADAPF
jgi:hypothetical protein